ncbi:hypothetical protein HU200_009670 [Digitaria exilis]|uniref:Uncharacterized protein n=1 Tax=Digitaria exilis TaxID=1010633 RepID=A0A835FII9_9POAL|nr:hypothetical protein HU200_009670 [Digitaria exilis]
MRTAYANGEATPITVLVLCPFWVSGCREDPSRASRLVSSSSPTSPARVPPHPRPDPIRSDGLRDSSAAGRRRRGRGGPILPRPLDAARHGRWLGTLAAAASNALRVYMVQGFYIVTYGPRDLPPQPPHRLPLPMVDPELDPSAARRGPALPTGIRRFKPSSGASPEFKFWSDPLSPSSRSV